MTKPYLLVVNGKQSQWLFNVELNPRHIEDLRADGLEVNECFNSIPYWVVEHRLTRPWVFVQDLFHFRNPFIV